MIKKIVSIKNVARFENYSHHGNTSLERLTLIYSENGRGKSTLSTILDSLARNKSELILERKTIDGTGQPEVKLLGDGNAVIEFNGARWVGARPEILVFNSNWVHDNVYAGHTIEPEHRRNHANFVLGDVGVALMGELNALDVEGRDNLERQSNLQQEIAKYIPRGLAMNSFLTLGNDAGIDDKIADAQTEVDRISIAADIATHSELQPIKVPAVNDREIEELLASSMASVHAEAERKTRDHIRLHLDEHGEDWLGRGLRYMNGTSCPFCGQLADSVDLVKAYREFFDGAYVAYKSDASNRCSAVERAIAIDGQQVLVRAIEAERASNEYWRTNGVVLRDLLPTTQDVENTLRDLRNAMQTVLTGKRTNPTQAISPTADVQRSLQQFAILHRRLAAYNGRVPTHNAAVVEVKRRYSGASLAVAQSQLLDLQGAKIRHEAPVRRLAHRYELLAARRPEIEREKRDSRTKLDTYSRSLFTRYQAKINQYLVNAGAEFQVTDYAPSYAGGKASASYALAINGGNVPVGTIAGQPCFRNTLSDGDRTTLAFAFFLAKAELDPSLELKVIVIDDPIGSLDDHRRICTRDAVIGLVRRASQVIVLSHMPEFHWSIYEAVGGIPVKTLKMLKKVVSAHPCSDIEEWNIEKAVRSEYKRMFDELREYAADPNSHDRNKVVRQIRPVLEGYLRLRYGPTLPPNKWLGDFIGMIRAAASGDALFPMRPFEPELSLINEFSKIYHHEDGSVDLSGLQDSALQP